MFALLGSALSLLALSVPQSPPAESAAAASPAAAPFPDDVLHYRCLGPTRGGRSTAVAGVRQRPGVYYFGATGGGVWKTEDHGARWRNVSDGAFASPSIGAIRAAPSEPDVVLVGTGSDGLRSNVIPGRGVYLSTDAGANWRHVGLEDAGQIGAVEFHPHDADVACVAVIGDAFAPSATRGLYRTRDRGATWERVLFISERTGIVDVEFQPGRPEVLYAAAWQAERKPWTIRSGGREGGVFKSVDGGASWQQLGGGLPDGVVGKADLAVSPADPSRLYVLIEAPGDAGGVYRSSDAGASFVQVSSARRLRVRPFYYTNIDADPTDADIVHVSATGYYVSSDAGRSWQRRRTPHGDNHDLWIHPERPELRIQSNDGGANCSVDGGRTWSTQHNQPTAELYQIAVDDRFPAWVYAGQQDNSTIRVPVLPPYPHAAGAEGYWERVGGCETGPVIPRPGDAAIVYANCKGRFSVYNARTGQEQRYDVGAASMYGHDPADLRYRFQRVAPIHVSPHDPGVIYHASQFVHRTTDEGRTWTTISPDLTRFDPEEQGISGEPITRDITGEEFYSTLYALAESPLQRGLIWVGAGDGPVHVTRDGGGSWQDVTPPALPPGGRVQTVAPSPHRAATCYLTVLRYMLGDDRPHVYRTDDFGASWTALGGPGSGLPQDIPARVVREDPQRPGLLYCGAEFGAFVSFDDGAHWQSLQGDLPVVPITDLRVHDGDLLLSTMGRSFWMLDDLSALRQWDAELAGATLELITPRPAVRMRYRARRGVPEYPAPGAVIEYVVGADGGDEPLTLEVFDDGGALVRAFSSEAPGERWEVPAEPAMHDFALQRAGTPRLPAEAGLQRFRWDLRHAGAWHAARRRAGARGPLVAPGEYRLQLRRGAVEREVWLTVRRDPRVADAGISAADLRAQQRAELRLRDAISRGRVLAAQLEARLAELGDDAPERAAVAALHEALVTAEGTYPQPKLLDQLGYLRGILGAADQAPGGDALDRLDELEEQLDALIERGAELTGV